MRASVLYGAFALIFLIPSICFSAYPGSCVRTVFYQDGAEPSSGYNYSNFTITNGIITLTSAKNGPQVRGYVIHIWNNGTNEAPCWIVKNQSVYRWYHADILTYVDKVVTSAPGGWCGTDPAQSNYWGVIGNCSVPCDTDDDDSDGVCNQCDQLPGVPDQDDCLRGTSTNAAGETTSAFIDKGCQGQTGEWWTAENYSSNDSFVASIGDTSENKGKLNCVDNCTLDGQEQCNYGSSALGQIVGSMQSSSVAPSQTSQEIIDSLLDLPSPLDMPDRCDGHNQQCKEYCEDKLGVGMSYCYEKDGKKKSNCVCNNDFAYDMVTDSDTPAMEQADINKDSNGSGVPDYADDTILNQGDSDSDGITDKADVDQTGGQDSNGDGIDDAYTANAQASANASAGLSKSDSLNLDSIATSTAQTSAATQGLKTGIDKIAENTGDLREKADAALAESQAIRAKLDSFNEDGTASLATQQGQLVDGLFPGIQPGDIPDDPTENFDVDAFVQEFSFAFPNEVKTIIEGSSVQVQNPDSCVTGEIMGQPVQFCFDRFQAVFLAMGLLFKGLCVWRAIEIIAVGVRA